MGLFPIRKTAQRVLRTLFGLYLFYTLYFHGGFWIVSFLYVMRIVSFYSEFGPNPLTPFPRREGGTRL